MRQLLKRQPKPETGLAGERDLSYLEENHLLIVRLNERIRYLNRAVPPSVRRDPVAPAGRPTMHHSIKLCCFHVESTTMHPALIISLLGTYVPAPCGSAGGAYVLCAFWLWRMYVRASASPLLCRGGMEAFVLR